MTSRSEAMWEISQNDWKIQVLLFISFVLGQLFTALIIISGISAGIVYAISCLVGIALSLNAGHYYTEIFGWTIVLLTVSTISFGLLKLKTASKSLVAKKAVFYALVANSFVLLGMIISILN